MKIEDVENLKTGDSLWCVVPRNNLSEGMPMEFIFLRPMGRVNCNVLRVAWKADGIEHTINTAMAEKTKNAAIMKAISFVQEQIDISIKVRNRFEDMLSESDEQLTKE